MDYKTMKTRMRKLRKGRSLSRERLSEMPGISPWFMLNFEIGNRQ